MASDKANMFHFYINFLVKLTPCFKKLPLIQFNCVTILVLIGYEPAGLTVHPPPQMIEGGFFFFVWVSGVGDIKS